MPRGCDHFVYVEVEKRKFRVEYDADGSVLRIKERKVKTHPIEGVFEQSYWVASSHVLGSGDTLPKRIVAAARAKLEVEHRQAMATP